MKVADVAGAVAIVDALVALRSCAFGLNAAGINVDSIRERVGSSSL